MVLPSQKVTHTPLRGSFKGICGFYLNAPGRISGDVMARRDSRRSRRDARQRARLAEYFAKKQSPPPQ
jgi:hypothetical protein